MILAMLRFGLMMLGLDFAMFGLHAAFGLSLVRMLPRMLAAVVVVNSFATRHAVSVVRPDGGRIVDRPAAIRRDVLGCVCVARSAAVVRPRVEASAQAEHANQEHRSSDDAIHSSFHGLHLRPHNSALEVPTAATLSRR